MWPSNLTDEEFTKQAALLSVTGLADLLKVVSQHAAQETQRGASAPSQSHHQNQSLPSGAMGRAASRNPRGIRHPRNGESGITQLEGVR